MKLGFLLSIIWGFMIECVFDDEILRIMLLVKFPYFMVRDFVAIELGYEFCIYKMFVCW